MQNDQAWIDFHILFTQPIIRNQALIRFLGDMGFQAYNRGNLHLRLKMYFRLSEAQNRNQMLGQNQILGQNQVLGKIVSGGPPSKYLSLFLFLIGVRAWLFKDPLLAYIGACWL